ncbi:sigma-70 family RNA polymerase sigma factor [Flavobacterium sp. '19STA2R22 D10 B1']|uniref:sigma-70 family RNA polymerase sigma factor n=1 Tax=Flavobacterium aerium TaxID=3037261 RepID=UPI00278C0C39|nr:sigma-70 family RNA polymerase sigma factor [Flavobacterium sp. '19STA2R22 D10 B1']
MEQEPKNVIAQWLNEFGDELYSWAYYKTSREEIAQDLVQDTFIAAFENLHKFKEQSAPKTWLLSILNNKIVDFYRKKSKEYTISYEEYSLQIKLSDAEFDDTGHWEDMSDKSSQNWLDNPEFNSILAKCIKKLPKNWQFIIQSKYILDKESKEICQELDVTTSNYWQIIHRSKVLLKKCIEINWI